MSRQQSDPFETSLDTAPSLSGVPALGSVPAFSRWIVWALACILILGGIVYVTQGNSEQSMEPLFGGHGLSELELNQVELAFSSAGLDGWDRDLGVISIPRNTRHEYLAALEKSSALPYAMRSDEQTSYSGASFFESESQRKSRQQFFKERDLGNKIATFNDIAWASVDYDQQVTGGFDQRTIQSASILLVAKDGKPISPSRIGMIQDLVGAAYAGLEPDQVTVTDTSARKTYNPSDDPLTRRRRQSEYELEQRLTELLSGYRGLHIAVSSFPKASKGVSDEASADSFDATPQQMDSELVMRVSVGVPESQFHAQWGNDYLAAHPGKLVAEAPDVDQLSVVRSKVIENIRNAISPFVATNVHGDDDEIQVWSFPDGDQPKVYAADATQSFGLSSLIAAAKTHVAVITPIACLLLVAAVFAYAAVRLRIRSSSGDSFASANSTANRTAATQSGQLPVGDATSSQSGGATLRDDLADLVESNPELAAQIVHSWMSKAA